MSGIAVELEDVCKRFGDFEAVNRVSLRVRQGEFFSLLGPSGCGKTTTLRLVVLPALWPAVVAAGLLVFALSFDDFVLSFFTTGESPQPLPVRIWTQIRFGVRPTINAIGTFMLVISTLSIGLALLLPRLLGRRESGLKMLLGREGA